MTGPEHVQRAEDLAHDANLILEEHTGPAAQAGASPLAAVAQVHATLAQAAATERLAMAVENLPMYEGMLSVYAFGVNR